MAPEGCSDEEATMITPIEVRLVHGVLNQGFGATAGNLTNQGFGFTQDGLDNQGFGATNGGITNQTFGETPMGSGLLILLAAGAGYATLKKRKSNR